MRAGALLGAVALTAFASPGGSNRGEQAAPEVLEYWDVEEGWFVENDEAALGGHRYLQTAAAGQTEVVVDSGMQSSSSWSGTLEVEEQTGALAIPPAPPAPTPIAVSVESVVYAPELLAAIVSNISAAVAAHAAAVAEGGASLTNVEIASTMTFAATMSNVAVGTPARAEFVAGFKERMAAKFGIEAGNVAVDRITAGRRRLLGVPEEDDARRRLQTGSVVVAFHIQAPLAVANEAASVLATMQSSGETFAVTVGAQAFTANTSTLSPPVVTRAPDVDCEGRYVRDREPYVRGADFFCICMLILSSRIEFCGVVKTECIAECLKTFMVSRTASGTGSSCQVAGDRLTSPRAPPSSSHLPPSCCLAGDLPIAEHTKVRRPARRLTPPPARSGTEPLYHVRGAKASAQSDPARSLTGWLCRWPHPSTHLLLPTRSAAGLSCQFFV